jgi:CheY-like chemotaxis protein
MEISPIILVAEDNPSDQLLLRRALEKAGLKRETKFVQNGFGVVETFRDGQERGKPSLLLLDLKMPGMDGFEVLEWFQRHPESRPRYLAVLTASLFGDDLTRAASLGVDHYLAKTGDQVEFAAALKRLEPYCTEQHQGSTRARELASASFA